MLFVASKAAEKTLVISETHDLGPPPQPVTVTTMRSQVLPSLKNNKSPLKSGGWKMISFPFGARPNFSLC